MSGADWLSLGQAVLLGFCTWYVRRGARFDAFDVKLNTSSVDQVRVLQAQVLLLRDELGILKERFFRQFPENDDRKPF